MAQFSVFKKHPEIVYGISSREDGNLAFYAGPDREGSFKRREVLLDGLGLDLDRAVFMQQTHSDHIRVVGTEDVGRGTHSHEDTLLDTDALITKEKGVTLCVQVADCVPVLLYDPVQRVIGVVHAGWRGTMQNISGKAIQQMMKEFKSHPADVLVVIGPAIGPCCFEVGEDIVEQAQENGYAGLQGSAWDLWEANKSQLIDVGVIEKNIEIMRECTSCQQDDFYSFRREGNGAGRMLVVIALKEE